MCCDLSVAVAVVGVFFGVSLGTGSVDGTFRETGKFGVIFGLNFPVL